MPDHLRPLERALISLAHPLSLVAISALLVNALVLQPYAPSWFSGKLGDAAGMVFLPFLIALPCAFFISSKWVGLAAILLTGAIFAAIKTVPWLNGALVTTLPLKAALDPSDVTVLPVLVLAWHIWQHPVILKTPTQRAWKTLGVSLSLFALLADSPALPPAPATLVFLTQAAATRAPAETAAAATDAFLAPTRLAEAGILCVRILNDAVVAGTHAFDFRSTDGGLMWVQINPAPRTDTACDEKFLRRGGTTLRDPDDPKRSYIFDSKGIRHFESVGSGTITEFQPDPAPTYYDFVYDPISHNIIVAIGKEGLLVRTPNANWQFIAVGTFKR